VKLKLNGILQHLAYVDDVILLEMLLTRRQNAGQSRDFKIANRWFEYVSEFRYLETTITNQNVIQEEIKRRMNSCKNHIMKDSDFACSSVWA
jgi:hypothetical protein